MATVLRFERSIMLDNPVGADECKVAERILARLVAGAYAADHPELFGTHRLDVAMISSRREKLAPTVPGRDDQETTTAGGISARV
jgi:hypothetical protein